MSASVQELLISLTSQSSFPIHSTNIFQSFQLPSVPGSVFPVVFVLFLPVLAALFPFVQDALRRICQRMKAAPLCSQSFCTPPPSCSQAKQIWNKKCFYQNFLSATAKSEQCYCRPNSCDLPLLRSFYVCFSRKVSTLWLVLSLLVNITRGGTRWLDKRNYDVTPPGSRQTIE